MQFTAPAGLVFTTANSGADATDSDANTTTGFTGCYVLGSGEHNPTVDAGLKHPPKASLGDFVWKDLDKDGQQDSGEWGISGVTVKLLDCATPPAVLSTTTTDSNGKYLFSNLTPGSYAVEFVLPSGYAFTLQNTGADATDSDANTTTGRTGCYVLDPGENELTVDAGLIHAPKASLGDFVWKDLDKDGQQDSGEWAIPGVTVKLLNCATPPAVLSTTTTDSNGKYLFSNLSAGSYAVEFVLPSGYAFTLQNTGADATDSDANTGSPVGRTGCYVLDRW